MWLAFWVVAAPPSPKSHCHCVAPPVEASVTFTVTGTTPLVGLAMRLNPATGFGGGVAVVPDGRYSICAIAVEWNLIVDPPNTPLRSGVRSWKRPATETLTVLFAAAIQAGEQATVTSAGATETAEPFIS